MLEALVPVKLTALLCFDIFEKRERCPVYSMPFFAALAASRLFFFSIRLLTRMTR